MTKKILLVDDEPDIIELLAENLGAENYAIIIAGDGDAALDLATIHNPDLVLLDLLLPGRDGWDVLRELRKNPATEKIPVIILTAKDSEIDEVLGLELGADDYIIKPVKMRTLHARIKNALRKSQKPLQNDQNALLSYGDLEIDPTTYNVRIGNREVRLTKKEFDILFHLARKPGRVFTRQNLLNQIWGQGGLVIDRTIDVHVRKIREKLGQQHMHLIETIKGVGYRFRSERGV